MQKTESKPKALLAVAVVLGMFVFQQLAAKVGVFVANRFSYTRIDPDGQFMWISVHHVVQMGIALAVILLLRKVWGIDFGLRAGHAPAGLIFVARIAAVILVITVAVEFIRSFYGFRRAFEYPLNARNVLGTLGFQLLLSGPSEELLFRALPIGVMWHILGKGKLIRFGRFVRREFVSRSWKTVYPAGIVAAVLFALAHINWNIAPFTVTYDSFQLMLSFMLGVAYAMAYEHSDSVLYPMLLHSLANIISVGTAYLFAIFY